MCKGIKYQYKCDIISCYKGAFTNYVIILGGGGLENMTQDDGGGGVGLKILKC